MGGEKVKATNQRWVGTKIDEFLMGIAMSVSWMTRSINVKESTRKVDENCVVSGFGMFLRREIAAIGVRLQDNRNTVGSQ